MDQLYRLKEENHVDMFKGNGVNRFKLYNAQLVKQDTREKIPIVFGRHLNNSSSKTRHTPYTLCFFKLYHNVCLVLDDGYG